LKVIFDRQLGRARCVADGEFVQIDQVGVPQSDFIYGADRNQPAEGAVPVDPEGFQAGWNLLNVLDYRDVENPATSTTGLCNLTLYDSLYEIPTDFLEQNCTTEQRLFGNSIRVEVQSFRLQVRNRNHDRWTGANHPGWEHPGGHHANLTDWFI